MSSVLAQRVVREGTEIENDRRDHQQDRDHENRDAVREEAPVGGLGAGKLHGERQSSDGMALPIAGFVTLPRR